jgi:hypothetical protein
VLVGVLLAAALLVTESASAQKSNIYKWKDEKGVIHYSNSPPPEGTKATVLDESKSKVSVVPSVQVPADSATGTDKLLQNRVRRLERELEDERRSQAASSQAQSEAYQRWREECLKQRRLDCDDPTAAASPIYGYPAPPVVRPPPGQRPPGQRPPGQRPQPPDYPSAVPPGYTVGPGPGGIGGQYVPMPSRPQVEEPMPERPRAR